METKAQLNYLRISPRKVRIVAGLIKGMNVKRALLELQHLTKRASLPITKLIRSALANAQYNFQLKNDEDFYIKRILVNQGPMLKRLRPRAFGRAAPVRKKMSHVSLVLEAKGFRENLRKKHALPVVKESGEGIQEEFEAREKEKPRIKEKPLRTKSVGFVRRMFRRKAI